MDQQVNKYIDKCSVLLLCCGSNLSVSATSTDVSHIETRLMDKVLHGVKVIDDVIMSVIPKNINLTGLCLIPSVFTLNYLDNKLTAFIIFFFNLAYTRLEPNSYLQYHLCWQTSVEDGGIDRLIRTQRDPGGARVRVDPEGQPGEDHDEQRGGVDTHHVEANLTPQGEDDLHTGVVPCTEEETEVTYE